MTGLRRLLSALGLAAAIVISPAHAQPTWQPSNGEKLEFDVFRDGSRFGKHIVSFTRENDLLIVDTDIELKVALGPLTVFHYVHDVTERYSAGRLISLAAKTKKDGRWKTLAADAVEGGLNVAGAAFKGLRTGAVIPSTHWNIAQMGQSAMFSTETGAMLPIEVIDQGVERVKTSAGEIDARRYLVRSDLDATFWYDASGRWVKCAFTAQGARVEYVLREFPS